AGGRGAPQRAAGRGREPRRTRRRDTRARRRPRVPPEPPVAGRRALRSPGRRRPRARDARGAAMKALLVDDTRLARLELRTLLAAHPDVELVGEADDLPSAREACARLVPDLLLLDIQ